MPCDRHRLETPMASDQERARAMSSRPLSEENVRNLILDWYHATNEHLPGAELELMLADNVRMSYPNRPEVIEGIPAFREWYADVLVKYFDETHVVESWDIAIEDDTAVAVVVVRWETRSWTPGSRASEYAAYLSRQRFRIARSPVDGRVQIHEKHVETFHPTASVYGPFLNLRKSGDRVLDVRTAVTASRAGNDALLRDWLCEGGNPNQYDEGGWTPLLAASVRGKAAAVSALLNARNAYPADPDMPFRKSGALPIHFAGQSGDVATAQAILQRSPEHLDAVWLLNGHSLLLQAVFYGHLPLARYALEQGADTAITTARGLSAEDLAQQFQNTAMVELLRPFSASTRECSAYHETYKQRIAAYVPSRQSEQQEKAERLVQIIESSLLGIRNRECGAAEALAAVSEFIARQAPDPNRMAGALQQPPIVVAVTGNNGDPASSELAEFRLGLVEVLLSSGADPTTNERHPMGVNAIIRAAVFSHLAALKAMGQAIGSDRLAAEINRQPAVNGLTALHDSVLRASTAGEIRLEGYLEQVRWLVRNGARTDIEDFSGITQRMIAESIQDEQRRSLLLEALLSSRQS